MLLIFPISERYSFALNSLYSKQEAIVSISFSEKEAIAVIYFCNERFFFAN